MEIKPEWYPKEEDFDAERFVTSVLQSMPEGGEVTLNQLNKVCQFFRIYELYEITHRVLAKNFQLFRFTRQKELGESVILKTYLR